MPSGQSILEARDSGGGFRELLQEFGFKELAACASHIRLVGQAMSGRGGRFHFPLPELEPWFPSSLVALGCACANPILAIAERELSVETPTFEEIQKIPEGFGTA